MPLTLLRDTLYIVEEPEAHQHPRALENLARTMCGLAEQRQIQLLLTTHSLECVNAFTAAAKSADLSNAVFHLSLDGGKLRSRKLTTETVESLSNVGTDIRRLDDYK